jgi:hypothetical protein
VGGAGWSQVVRAHHQWREVRAVRAIWWWKSSEGLRAPRSRVLR